MRYNVNGIVTAYIGFSVEVEAETREEAEEKAKYALEHERQYRVHDFDGNPVDFDEVNINDVEEQP